MPKVGTKARPTGLAKRFESERVSSRASGAHGASKLSFIRGLGEGHGTIAGEVASPSPQALLGRSKAFRASDQDSQLKRAIESDSRSSRPRKQRLMLLATGLAVSCWMVFVSWQSTRTQRVHRIDLASPYENTRPEVRYLGDSACAGCHAKSAETFRQHPMARSLAPIGESYVMKGGEGSGQTLFESQGLRYSIELRDAHVFHQETRRDESGHVVAKNEAEVKFVIGSGRQGAAYLVEHDGFLFQSPLTWYSRKQRWDLSPGFETFNYHFDRPIQPNCLYCHANRVEPIPGRINQYRPPIFQGHAIGCERCHGPGELHVARRAMVNGKDMTIVNPADLAPALRDDVCAQCHLAGHSRILRVGRRSEDYRPGLPFPRYWTVFVQPPDGAGDRFVGQIEQMQESRCFRASRGRLGCISCHDPHDFPAPADQVAYYRDRCLACHAQRGCSLPASARLEQSKDDDCASCHMPKANSFDIPHAASANHRIPRNAGGENSFMADLGNTRRDKRQLVVFHNERMDAQDRAEVERDRGVALCRDGKEGARIALPLLEAALAVRSDDVIAWECRGHALYILGRNEEAMAALQKALTIEPGRESALVEAARVAFKLDRRLDAATYSQRAIRTNHWRSDYHGELALVYFQNREWQASADACQQALRLNSSWLKVRKLLIQCYLNLGKTEAARAELDTVLGFDPPDRADLLRSFAVQSKSGIRAP
jgi:Tetratricopeptide repeat/Cytochrome c554 and c-prime